MYEWEVKLRLVSLYHLLWLKLGFHMKCELPNTKMIKI